MSSSHRRWPLLPSIPPPPIPLSSTIFFPPFLFLSSSISVLCIVPIYLILVHFCFY
jgi:hypothetical protein